MNSFLRLRFLNDGDGTGKLLAWAEADGFAGRGGAYFNIEVLDEFAGALQVFPFPPDDSRRSIAGGFSSKEDPEGLSQEHRISVYPADAQRGYIGIQVRMATELWPETRPQSKKQASVEIVSTYEPVSKFSRDILAVVRGSLKEAVFEGHSIS
jgi:hypothetical protein